MDFNSMSKQRKFVFFASVAGIISMFLPWISISFLGVNQSQSGMHGWGVLAFFCFVGTALISLYGNQKLNLDRTLWMLVLLLALIPLLIAVTFYFDATNSILGSNFIGFGVYITAIAAIAAIGAAWLYKSPADNLKAGFDSLKKNVEQRLASVNTGAETSSPSPNVTVTDTPPPPVSPSSSAIDDISPTA